MQLTRIMALDFGEVRIGIAMSDLMKIISSPYETYKRVDLEKDLSYLSNLAIKNAVDTIVIGLPYNMDGTEGDRAKATKVFAEKLKERVSCEIVFQDERLSSVEAEEILINAKVRREERKNIIDKLAAQIILQSYLDSKKKEY